MCVLANLFELLVKKGSNFQRDASRYRHGERAIKVPKGALWSIKIVLFDLSEALAMDYTSSSFVELLLSDPLCLES